MPTIIKPNIKTEIVKIYQKGIQAQTTNAYFFLGKLTSWEDSDLGGGGGIYNNNNPPTPETGQAYEVETRRNIISLQKADVDNTVLAVRRTDWQSGTVYDMYDPRYSQSNPAPSGATNLAEAAMIVLTDEFNVYKCIYNNDGGPSTIKPTGTSTSYIQLNDGYIWKYMTTISIDDRNKHVTTRYIPVSDALTEEFFADGQIGFQINSGGSGYVQDNTVLTVTGDGSGASLEAVVSNGTISNVVVKNAGANYSSATINITTPDSAKAQGTGGDIDAIINEVTSQSTQTDVQLAAVDGEISSISISSGGSGYTTATATISGDGSNAEVVPVISGGAITSFTYTNRGSGYSNATISVTGDGTGFAGEVILGPPNGHGFSFVNEAYPTAISTYVTGIDALVQSFDITSPYGQIGIILDPIKYNSNDESSFLDKVTATSATPCYKITSPSIVANNYDVPEKLLDSDGNEYLVAAVENGNMLIQSLTAVEPTSGITLATQDIFPINVVIDSDGAITDPTFDRTTGSILYIDNRVPFTDAGDQIVNLKTIIEF